MPADPLPQPVWDNEPLPVYNNTTRPDASELTVCLPIFNTDDCAPNWSNGTDWVDADGHIT